MRSSEDAEHGGRGAGGDGPPAGLEFCAAAWAQVTLTVRGGHLAACVLEQAVAGGAVV